MNRWLFVRHGESTANRARRFSGHTDVPLTPYGRQQAEACGHTLRQRLDGRTLHAVWSSDLQRARDTAECILRTAEFDLLLRTHPALREQNLGEWEGESIAVVRSQCPETSSPMDWTRRAPGGESLLDVAERSVDFLTAVEPGESILIVGHGGLLRTLIGLIDGVPRVEIGETEVPHAQIITRDLAKDVWRGIASTLLG